MLWHILIWYNKKTQLWCGTMKKQLLSNAVLKNIAYLTMLIDHFFAVIFTEIMWRHSMVGDDTSLMGQVYATGRAVGRISFVLFAYLTVEGFMHTKSRLKYLLRLSMFALVSEVPFDLAFSGEVIDLSSQNIFFTLSISVLLLTVWEWAGGNIRRMCRRARRDVYWYICVGVFRMVQFGAVLLGCGTAQFLRVDYKYMGVLLIFTFYILRNQSFLVKIVPAACVMFLGTWSINIQRYAGDYTTAYLFRFSMRELYGLFAFIPITLYDGTKGRQLPKAVCYGFYPVHLLVLYGIARMILMR